LSSRPSIQSRDPRLRRVVAYIRVSEGQAATAPVPWRSIAGEDQDRIIHRWATAHQCRVTSLCVDRAPEAGDEDHNGARAGFLRALSIVRNRDADAICVAALQQLDDDLVIQECLLSEARRAQVEIVSASEDDRAELADPPSDPLRALVRRTIDELPAFQGEMRSLRAWLRRTEAVEEFERSVSLLARLDSSDEPVPGWPQGAHGTRHRIGRLLRLRRLMR